MAEKKPTNRFRQIFLYCEECIRCYDPNPFLCITPDAHVAVYFPKRNITDPDEKAFIRHVLLGVTKYRDFLEITVQAYCEVMKRARQEDGLAFSIIIYLSLFRLQEIGLPAFRNLIEGATLPVRVAELLRFLFDLNLMRTHLAPRWKTVYDDDYVDKIVEPHIAKFSEQVLPLADSIDASPGTAGESTKGSTTQKSLKGTLPGGESGKPQPSAHPPTKRTAQPRELKGIQVEFERHDPLAPPRPVVDTATEAQKAVVEAARTHQKNASTLPKEVIEENRRKEEISRREIKPFRMKTDEIVSRRSRALQEMLDKAEQEARPELTSVKSPQEVHEVLTRPPLHSVKLTHATMLREDKFYQKREIEEQAAIHKIETELRDDSEFREWQQKMLAKDEETRRILIAQRKVDMRMADEAAKDAKRAQIHANQDFVLELKERITEERKRQTEVLLVEAAERRINAEEQSKILEEGLREAKTKLTKKRIDDADVIREEKHRDMVNLALNFEMERQRKQDLIKEFKEAHTQNSLLRENVVAGVKGHVFVRTLDKEACSDIGILNEMSLAQLQRELLRVKDENLVLESFRRDSIVRARSQREDEASERMSRIDAARSKVRTEKEEARKKRREMEALDKQQKNAIEEKHLQELQIKLAESREAKEKEEQARKAAERARRVASQLLAADAGAMEEKRWAELERGAQNAALRAQNNRLVAQRIRREVEAGAHIVRETNLQSEAEMHAEARAWSDAQQEGRVARGKTRAEHDYELKMAVVLAEKEKLKARRFEADLSRVNLMSARSAPMRL